MHYRHTAPPRCTLDSSRSALRAAGTWSRLVLLALLPLGGCAEQEAPSHREVTIQVRGPAGEAVETVLEYVTFRGDTPTINTLRSEEGEFTFPAPTDLAVDVAIQTTDTAENLHLRDHTLLIPRGNDSVNLQVALEAGRRASGIVIGPAGEPAAEVNLSWVHFSDHRFHHPSGHTQSDASGQFVAAGLEPARASLTAIDGEGRMAHLEVDLETADLADLVVQLGEGHLIEGQVLGLDDEELSLIGVTASPLDEQWAGTTPTTQIDRAGDFKIRLPSEGRWRLSVNARQTGRHAQIEVGGDTPLPPIALDFDQDLPSQRL